jgi:hypothetical protein
MAGENLNIINLVGQVGDPTQTSQPDANNVSFLQGRQSELLASEIHGQAYTANYRGKLFQAAVSAVTFPVVTATVAAVFTLYNPPGSGVNAELIYTTMTMQLSTAVVDTIGWYFGTPPQSQASTFTTKGTVNSGKLGASVGNNVLFYSAMTWSGTPVLGDVVGGFGGTTNTTAQFPYKAHNGSLILPQGVAMSLLTSTTVGATTGWGAETKWVEWPA